MQKILIISPTPTHPAYAGNRAHITELSKLLQKKGFEVFFLYLAYEDFDRTEMTRFWGNHLFIIEKVNLFEKGPLVTHYFKRLLQEAGKIKRYLQYKTGSINELQLRFNAEIDNYFPGTIKSDIRALQNEHHFDIVFCEYVSFSRALTFFQKKVFKILDTHDRFTDRFSIYLKNGLHPEWLSLYADQEKKALDRSNLVIAVQDEEREYFSSLTKVPVIRYCTVFEAKKIPQKNFAKTLLYFASSNKVNNITLQNFEKEIMPLIKKKHPDVQLLVGGSICKTYLPVDKNTELRGIFEDPRDFYSSGDVIINPEFDGTGYKIKTMEALCYGLPMVCSEVVAKGLTHPFIGQFLIANDPVDFANAVHELFINEKLRLATSAKAIEWIKNLKETVTNNLLNNLPAK